MVSRLELLNALNSADCFETFSLSYCYLVYCYFSISTGHYLTLRKRIFLCITEILGGQIAFTYNVSRNYTFIVLLR
jgi:hypothetical protein